MGEFYVIAKFQGKGIGRQVAHQIWESYQGLWEVSVIPENKSALTFWRNAIENFMGKNYLEETKVIDYDEHQPQRIIFNFDTNLKDMDVKHVINVDKSTSADILSMVNLSYDKRRSYEKAQPQFWKYGGD